VIEVPLKDTIVLSSTLSLVVIMPVRRSGKATREEGLEKTDNDLEFTSWPQVNMINQKNYYTSVASAFADAKLKREKQVAD